MSRLDPLQLLRRQQLNGRQLTERMPCRAHPLHQVKHCRYNLLLGQNAIRMSQLAVLCLKLCSALLRKLS